MTRQYCTRPVDGYPPALASDQFGKFAPAGVGGEQVDSTEIVVPEHENVP